VRAERERGWIKSKREKKGRERARERKKGEEE
jgi:hypothetical protein